MGFWSRNTDSWMVATLKIGYIWGESVYMSLLKTLNIPKYELWLTSKIY